MAENSPLRRPGWMATALGLLAAAGAIATEAAAQPVDRGALETMFGEPVTTSGSGKPQRASDTSVAMDIITAEQIRRSGAHDLASVLARYTTLDVQQYNAHDFGVGVRGFTTPMAQRLLVLVDGRQVYLDHYGYAAWDSIPVQLGEIRQIEVVRGPNSALFGFNAASGVINIITYEPALDRVSNATIRTGTGNYREASGVATAPLGEHSGIRLSAGLRGEQPWKTGYTEFESAELDGQRKPSRTQFASEVSLQLAPNVQAGLSASYSRAIGGNFMDYGQFWREDKRVWSLGGKLAVTTEYGLFDAQIYHNALDAGYAATAHPTTHHLTVAELGYAVKLGPAHTVRPLVQLRYATMSMLPGSEVHYAVLGTGAMWNWAVNDAVELTTSVRYDRLWLGARGYDDPNFPYGDKDYDRTLGEVSWNAALVWRATPQDTLRVSAARGVSLPSLSDFGWRDAYPEFGYQDTGTPSLSPTVVHSYELEYRRRLEAIDGRASILGFVEHYSGFSSGLSTAVFLPPAVPYNTYAPYNLGHAVLWGTEASITGKASATIDWGLRYRLSVPSSDFRESAQDPTHGSPRHLVTANAGWRRDALQIDLFGRYSSVFRAYRSLSEEATVLAEAKDYVSVAARVAYRLNDRLTLALEGENLLHGRQSQTLAAVAERRVYLSLRADF